MQSNLKNLSEVKKKLKPYLVNPRVFDVVLFGSFVKGKANPSDIDVAVISDCELEEIEGFHISFLSPVDFFKNTPTLVSTLIKEGFSLEHNKYFSAVYGFENRCMFIYELSGLTSSKKVQVVNFLRGSKNQKGLVEEKKGKWISQGCFSCAIEHDFLFDGFFINQGIKFKKYYLLMH